MNKLIKKLFVSLTLLVFCELILLQWIRGSNSRFDSIQFASLYLSASLADCLYRSICDPRLYTVYYQSGGLRLWRFHPS